MALVARCCAAAAASRWCWRFGFRLTQAAAMSAALARPSSVAVRRAKSFSRGKSSSAIRREPAQVRSGGRLRCRTVANEGHASTVRTALPRGPTGRGWPVDLVFTEASTGSPAMTPGLGNLRPTRLGRSCRSSRSSVLRSMPRSLLCLATRESRGEGGRWNAGVRSSESTCLTLISERYGPTIKCYILRLHAVQIGLTSC